MSGPSSHPIFSKTHWRDYFRRLRPYALAVAAIFTALLIELTFKDIFDGVPFFFFWPVVILISWYGGLRPGLLATILTVVLVNYFFLSPDDEFSLHTGDVLLLLLFAFTVIFIAWRREVETKTKDALGASDLRYRDLIENASDVIYTIDLNGNLTSINSAGEEISGFKRNELMGKPASQLMGGQNSDLMQEMISRKNSGERELVYEVEMLTKDGQRRVFEINSQLEYLDDIPIGLQAIARDITERQRGASLNLQLQNFALDLAAAPTTAEVAQVVVKALRNMAEDSIIGVFSLSVDGQKLERLDDYGIDDEIRLKFATQPLSANLPVIEAVMTQKVVLIETQAEYITRYPLNTEYVKALNLHGSICLPLLGARGVIGVMHLTFKYPHILDNDERNFMLVMAQACGQALERVRLFEGMEQAAERLSRLQTVTNALAHATTLPEVAQIAVEQTSLAFGAQSGTFTLYHWDNNTFELFHSTFDMPAEERAKWKSYPADPSYPITTVMQTRESLWFNSGVERHRQYPKLATLPTSHNGASALLPMITNDGQVTAILGLYFAQNGPFNAESQALAFAIIQQCTQAIERVQLVEQAKESAAYEERQRLARDLHDSVSQTLFSAATIAETVPRIWERNPEKSLEHLQQIVTLNRGALAEMRVLLWELRPEAILRAELNEMAQYLIEAARGRTRISGEMLENGTPMPLTDEAKMMIYRILQESINNILKHSRAKNFTVEIHYQPDHIRIQIKDDGQGFDIRRTTAGIGLSSMRERAEKIGAIFSIQSEIGKGTTVTVRWQPTLTILEQGV